MKLRTLFPITSKGLSGRGTLESRKFNAALFSYRKSRKINPRNNRQGKCNSQRNGLFYKFSSANNSGKKRRHNYSPYR